MRRLIALALSLIVLLPLSAFSIVAPQRLGEPFAVLSDEGDIQPLDDSVWYKRFDGILLEQLDEDVYKAEDVIVIGNDKDSTTLERALRFEDTTTVIFAGRNPLDVEMIADIGAECVMLPRRVSELEERLYGNEGIAVKYYRNGDVIDIADGLPVDNQDDGNEVWVVCPECGTRFMVRP